MSARRRVVVELSPGQVRLSVVEGQRLVATTTARLQLRGGEGFLAELAAMREPLSALVAHAGVDGAAASVIYSGAEAAVGVFSCPRRAGQKAAFRAASLALADAASLDLATNPHGLHSLMTDADASDAPPQVHTLGVATTDAEVAALTTLIEGADLRFAGATPASTFGMLEAVHSAKAAGVRGVAIVLHISDHDATIVGVASGRLRFVRQAAIGVEALVDAIVREALADTTGALHQLDRVEARAILLGQGIPKRGQDIEIKSGVRSAAILPILQSTLQRLIVEAKQSSRFGLTEAERAHAVLHLGGHGASIPRLGLVVSEMSGLALVSQSDSTKGLAVARTPGDMVAAGIASDLVLFPHTAAQSRLVEVVRRGVLIGAAAAFAVMMVSWGKARLDLHQIESEVRMVEVPQAEGSVAQALVEQVRAFDVALATSRDALAKASPTRVRVEALLLALADAAPASLRLTNIELAAGDENGTARVSGKVHTTRGMDPTAVIGAFIDGVSASPAVKTCKLVSTRRGGGEDKGDLLFELSVELVQLSGSSLASMGSQPSSELTEANR